MAEVSRAAYLCSSSLSRIASGRIGQPPYSSSSALSVLAPCKSPSQPVVTQLEEAAEMGPCVVDDPVISAKPGAD